MSALTVGSLFSGIGGLELGLERAGFGPTLWQVERDRHAAHWLSDHWPDATRYDDVGAVGAHNLTPVDLICGGFPCQPHSVAGQRKGSADERDLWGEFGRIVRELRPRYVVAENVPGLLTSDGGRFFNRVLCDLAQAGYDAEWDVFSAGQFGAPQLRERLFIVAWDRSGVGLADTRRGGVQRRGGPGEALRPASGDGDARDRGGDLEHATRNGREGRRVAPGRSGDRPGFGHLVPVARTGGVMGHPGGARRPQFEPPAVAGGSGHAAGQRPGVVGWADAVPVRGHDGTVRLIPRQAAEEGPESPLWPVAHGLPGRVARLRAAGNAVVPQVAEHIGRLILAADAANAHQERAA